MQKGEEASSPNVESQDKMLGSGVSDIVSPGGTSFVMQDADGMVCTSSISQTTEQNQHKVQSQGRLECENNSIPVM